MSKNIKPLNNEELLKAAPSIFSETPIEGVSSRYAFVPTYSVLDTFREAGYYPIMASESKVRNNENNQGYQKHIIQFRSLDNLLRPNSNEEYADIVLTNSHNRSSSFISIEIKDSFLSGNLQNSNASLYLWLSLQQLLNFSINIAAHITSSERAYKINCLKLKSFFISLVV